MLLSFSLPPPQSPQLWIILCDFTIYVYCLWSRPGDPDVICPFVRQLARDIIENNNERTEWPSDRVTKWLSDQVTKWLSDSVTWWLGDRVIKWLNDQMTGWQDDWKLRRRLTVWYIHYVTLPSCRPPYFDNKNFSPPLHIHLIQCHNNQCCFHVGYRLRKVHNSEHGVTKNMYEWRQGLTFLQFSPCLWHPPFHPRTSAQFGALS